MTVVRHADRISRKRGKTTFFLMEGNGSPRDMPDPVQGYRAERHGGITGRETAGRARSLLRILRNGIPSVGEETGGPGGFPS
jgi:hypothetical protein